MASRALPSEARVTVMAEGMTDLTTSTVPPRAPAPFVKASGGASSSFGMRTSAGTTRTWVAPTFTIPPPGNPMALSIVISARAT